MTPQYRELSVLLSVVIAAIGHPCGPPGASDLPQKKAETASEGGGPAAGTLLSYREPLLVACHVQRRL